MSCVNLTTDDDDDDNEWWWWWWGGVLYLLYKHDTKWLTLNSSFMQVLLVFCLKNNHQLTWNCAWEACWTRSHVGWYDSVLSVASLQKIGIWRRPAVVFKQRMPRSDARSAEQNMKPFASTGNTKICRDMVGSVEQLTKPRESKCGAWSRRPTNGINITAFAKHANYNSNTKTALRIQTLEIFGLIANTVISPDKMEKTWFPGKKQGFFGSGSTPTYSKGHSGGGISEKKKPFF